jgi:hypothetical protein
VIAAGIVGFILGAGCAVALPLWIDPDLSDDSAVNAKFVTLAGMQLPPGKFNSMLETARAQARAEVWE